MTKLRDRAAASDIHVVRGQGDGWLVAQGERPVPMASYRHRAHAMAFARAVAFGANSEMVVHEADGRRTRHARASLSYPTALD